MNEPTIDDIKRFARKVYAVCVIGMILGISVVVILFDLETVAGKLGRIAGFALMMLAILMLNHFYKLFREAKKKLRDPTGTDQDNLK